ncbi:MAG: Gfo/Idh/MocA family protein [Isosphaeraceae bacterium]
MSTTERPTVKIGVLGCGPVAQFAHLDACRKARNAELHAICDAASDLRERMAAVHQPATTHADYAAMLADRHVDAVIVAVADDFHVSAALAALQAGKHVLVEKPMGTNVNACRKLLEQAERSGLVVQVGNNRRFDPGMTFAHQFVREELGPRISLAAWYHDSVYRYTMTDNLQPIPLYSPLALRPAEDPKANRGRYFLLAHGSHLVDTARFLGGAITRVRARHVHRSGALCWFVDVDFADGALGHLDLHVPVRGDFQEGIEIQGEFGSVSGRIPLPWFHKTSLVECFSVRDRQYRRVLGEDAHTYKRQIEGFAACILDGSPQLGATAADGLAAVQALAAIARSVASGDWVRLDDVSGDV